MALIKGQLEHFQFCFQRNTIYDMIVRTILKWFSQKFNDLLEEKEILNF